MNTAPKPLWTPDVRFQNQSRLKHFIDYLFVKKGLYLRHYDDLWNWSVTNIDDFWETVVEYFEVQFHAPYREVIDRPRQGMIGTQWFPGATVSYAEHIFRNANNQYPALLYASEQHRLRGLSWPELAQQVAALAQFLKQQGVGVGDRVVALLPNVPEAVVGFLATQSLGAIWASCSPDFGTASVLDRFRQIEPTVLLMADGYTYNGKPIDKAGELGTLRKGLPSLQRIVWVPFLHPGVPAPSGTTPWSEVLTTPYTDLTFTPLPFDAPLWVLFSSGTTGKPKAITQSVGGCLLEHFKTLALHQDVRVGERYFWYSTTGWMMWNFSVASLLLGATLVIYEGSPGYPDLGRLWQLAEQAQITHFGGGAAFYLSCMRAGLKPGAVQNGRASALRSIRSIGSTGSPLPPEGFRWIYEAVRPDVWLISFSGGTDVCSGFVGGNPLLPVVAGEIQCRLLGCKVEAFDEAGQPVREQLGEMMILEPMPSMPIYFWNDRNDGPSGNERYRSSYFEQNPDVWRHGDFIKITDRGSVIIYGRSDATLNRDGVRIGTAEIYSAVESLPEIADSLVVGIEQEGGSYQMPLFVVLRPGHDLTDELRTRIRQALRSQYSPRHVPDSIHQIEEVPYTISGKKMETPVKKILMGQQADRVASPDTMRNPGALTVFEEKVFPVS